jgi:hypothetical protein
MFKGPNGRVVPRWGLQAEQQFVLPKGETVSMKQSVLETNRKAGVKAEYYACDRTGHGAGVADLLKYEWSSIIHDVNYSEGAGEEKLMQEDSKKCNEQFERMYSVLWFAMRQWGEFQYLLIHPQMDLTKLSQQLTNRRFRVLNGKSKVESKKDYESRGFGSPNEADSLSLLVHAARKGSGLILSMRGNHVEVPGGIDDTDDWPIPGAQVWEKSKKPVLWTGLTHQRWGIIRLFFDFAPFLVRPGAVLMGRLFTVLNSSQPPFAFFLAECLRLLDRFR